MTTTRNRVPTNTPAVKRTHGKGYADGGPVQKPPGEMARAAQKMRQDKALRRVGRQQQADKFASMKAAPKPRPTDAWPKDRPKPAAKPVATPSAKMSAGKAARAVAGRAGPVAAAGAAGAAIGSKIYEKNATRIQDGLEKLTRGKK